VTAEDREDWAGSETLHEIAFVAESAERIAAEIHRFIVGKNELIEMLLLCLLAEGHILITGTPGIAKTTTAKIFAHTLGCKFNRQQFTPEVLPSDVIGSSVFNQKTHEFYVRKGGIFANVVMVDEINRATPRTQAALLEAMAERTVTIEGMTFALESPFMLIATQSSIEFEGVYPLPAVQIDRFSVRMDVYDANPEEELEILALKKDVDRPAQQIVDAEAVLRMIELVQQVHVDDVLLQYMRDLIVNTRNDQRLLVGSSARGSIALRNLSKARAALQGREYVVPDDVKHVARPVLRHRLILSPEAFLDGLASDAIIEDVLDYTDVP
jgi:MoxR-like ATPase